MSENAVRLTVKLYDMRDYVKRMTTPEEYQKRIAEYQGYIRRAMEKWSLDELPATIKLAERVKHFPIAQAGVIAAYVEMIEPSEP